MPLEGPESDTRCPSSQIQLGFQLFGKDFIQEQQRMACLLDAYSEKLPTQFFFPRQIRACAPLKPELSQQPMGNDMERQRRKRLAKRRAIFSLYQQVGSYEKLMFSCDTIVLSFLPAIVLVFKIPQTSKGNASENV